MTRPRSGCASILATATLLLFMAMPAADAHEGAEVKLFYGYADCIRLSNANTEAILCPASGGRILKYALNGKNILFLPEGHEGWVWDGKSNAAAPMTAGRCDIGPEQVVPKRAVLWQGRWSGEIVGDRKAVLRSPEDPGTGVRLERTFELAKDSSKLVFTQRIVNVSDQTVEYCHWSRTFANGHGVCIIPLSGSEAPSRFPNAFVRYDPPGTLVNLRPVDENIQRDGEFLVITDHPASPKLGFDSYRGWLAYLSPQDLLFVKKFATYPDRVYNEAAGLTISVWYPENDQVELEPIGPRERLAPQEFADFTETWYLAEHPFPGSQPVVPSSVATIAESLN